MDETIKNYIYFCSPYTYINAKSYPRMMPFAIQPSRGKEKRKCRRRVSRFTLRVDLCRKSQLNRFRTIFAYVSKYISMYFVCFASSQNIVENDNVREIYCKIILIVRKLRKSHRFTFEIVTRDPSRIVWKKCPSVRSNFQKIALKHPHFKNT